MTHDNCATCRFWHVPFDREEWRTSECRRHAPLWKEGSGSWPRQEALWPYTEGRTWCGDFERVKPSKVVELDGASWRGRAILWLAKAN